MIIGIAIIVLGILYLIEIFNPAFSLDFGIIWPAALIFISLYYMAKDKKCSLTQGLLLFLGFWFLLVNTSLIVYPYVKAFWPIVLIILGTYLIFTSLDKKEMLKGMNSSKDLKERKKYSGIFGGIEEKVKTDDFKGADLYAIFGGIDLDLREVKLEEDAVINVYSFFGGTTVLVSDKYNVVCNSTAFLGSNENKTTNPDKKSYKTLTINCISVCGGTEIK